MIRHIAALLVLVILISGCIDNSPIETTHRAPTSQPIGVQMVQVVPDIKGLPFSTLLGFEMPTDSVFVSTSAAKTIGTTNAHTGKSSLELSDAATVKVKLASLLSGRKFPGDWALVGAYFYCDEPGDVEVACTQGSQNARSKIHLPAHQWTAAMVDISKFHASADGEPSLQFVTDVPTSIDDVMLIDNSQWLVGDDDSTAAGQWSVRRQGFDYICSTPGKFAIRVATAESMPGNGWIVDEVDAWRARFHSDGKQKFLTVYSDGRSYWDGSFRALASDMSGETLWADQTNSPAEIRVTESTGRLNRRSVGDANNDGYNESRASYMIVANGPRLELSIAPQSIPVLSPMLEITGMPAGNVLVTVEGRLVQNTLRLDDGTLLVAIPAKIGRPTTVNLRVE